MPVSDLLVSIPFKVRLKQGVARRFMWMDGVSIPFKVRLKHNTGGQRRQDLCGFQFHLRYD